MTTEEAYKKLRGMAEKGQFVKACCEVYGSGDIEETECILCINGNEHGFIVSNTFENAFKQLEEALKNG